MMLKALLKVRLAAFGAYFTGASRSQGSLPSPL